MEVHCCVCLNVYRGQPALADVTMGGYSLCANHAELDNLVFSIDDTVNIFSTIEMARHRLGLPMAVRHTV